MKSKILSLVIAAMIMFNYSFANKTDGNIDETVLNAFTHQFEKASDVSWTKTADYYKATFAWNGKIIAAFYGADGQSIAVSRNIVPSELPIVLQTSLTEEYSSFWISELFEYTTSENNKYYITIENADKKIILASMDSSYWEVFRKSGK